MMRLFSLPNLLSLLRLPLAAAFLLINSTTGRIIVVSLAALTDLIDGFLARRIRSHDRHAGQLVDPVTDKLFVLIAFITLAWRRELSAGVLLLVLARDIYNSVAFFYLKAKRWPIEFRARPSGKAVTVLQISLLLALLFWRAAVRPLIWLVGVGSAYAIVDYTQSALRKRRLAGAGSGA